MRIKHKTTHARAAGPLDAHASFKNRVKNDRNMFLSVKNLFCLYTIFEIICKMLDLISIDQHSYLFKSIVFMPVSTHEVSATIFLGSEYRYRYHWNDF